MCDPEPQPNLYAWRQGYLAFEWALQKPFRGCMEPEHLSRPWRALGIRLSVFPATAWEAPQDVWQDAVGEPPETDQRQPREHARIQSGPWREGSLQLTSSPMATVWQASPGATEVGLPNLEGWAVADVLPDFLSITRPWLVSAEFEIKRIGFGLNAVLSASDRISSYKILRDIINSANVDPENTSDLIYQINRPLPSKSMGDQVRLNRVMKWHAPRFGSVRFQIISGEPSAAAGPNEAYFACLESDTNTPADLPRHLDHALIGAIYDELVDLAWKTLEFGEILP